MMEISQQLNRILQRVIEIQQSDIPQQQKDKAKQIISDSLDFVIQQTDPSTINRLVYDELKKKKVSKL